ncbi:hypothetical protein LJC63_12900, partial [Ruminococcaceae bacterium OttesenSCG-928-L11]|nr:hypothetical protein [Ruminococcaceae bacterium OttesenSCG-928-L11]
DYLSLLRRIHLLSNKADTTWFLSIDNFVGAAVDARGRPKPLRKSVWKPPAETMTSQTMSLSFGMSTSRLCSAWQAAMNTMPFVWLTALL